MSSRAAGTMTGEQLERVRTKLGLSRPALARRIGISVSRLVDYESGIDRTRGKPTTIPRVVEIAIHELVRERNAEQIEI